MRKSVAEKEPKDRKISVHYGWIIVFTGLLANIGSHGFGRMAYSLILPEMALGLGLNWTMAGLLGTANFIGYLTFTLAGGYLASRYGSRKVITLSLLLTGVSLILTGTASTFHFALAMRFLTGMGNGGVYIPAMALGSLWFTSRKRGLATGIVGGGPGMGIFLSGIIVPPILRSGNWNSAWYILGGLVLIICGLCFLLLRDHPQEKSPAKRKKEESAVLQAELSSSCPNNAKASEASDTSSAPFPVRNATPEGWRSIYYRREVWHLGCVYFMYGFSYVIYVTFFHAFLTTEIGLSKLQAGTMWALAGGLSIFSAAMWGSISDLLGRKYGLSLVYFVNAIAYSLFFFSGSLRGLYLSIILFGLGMGSIPTIIAAAAGDQVGPRLTSTALGFVTIFFGIGQVLAPALGGYLADYTGSFRSAFAAAAFISLIGSAGSLLLKKPAASKLLPHLEQRTPPQ